MSCEGCPNSKKCCERIYPKCPNCGKELLYKIKCTEYHRCDGLPDDGYIDLLELVDSMPDDDACFECEVCGNNYTLSMEPIDG